MARAGPPAAVLFLVAHAATAAAPPPVLLPPWLPSWLRAFEIEVEARAAGVTWADTQARDVALSLRVHAGTLQLEATAADVAGGSARGTLVHAPTADTRVTLVVDGVDAGAIAPLRPYVTAMPSDLVLDLHARGATWSALAANAAGHLYLDHAGGGIIEKTFERAGGSLVGGLLGKVLTAFKPLRDAGETTVMECLRIAAPIVEGRLAAPLLLELWTPRMRVSGGGVVDLASGSLDLVLTPSPRQGIRIGGLDAVHTIDVTGTLAEPLVHVDSGRLLQRAAALGTVVATVGGRALIDTINTHRAAQREPCAALAPP
ncbi:MAG: AsmA-like C-terminal region-containing protein [Gammaproteobacteria bacterium]